MLQVLLCGFTLTHFRVRPIINVRGKWKIHGICSILRCLIFHKSIFPISSRAIHSFVIFSTSLVILIFPVCLSLLRATLIKPYQPSLLLLLLLLLLYNIAIHFGFCLFSSHVFPGVIRRRRWRWRRILFFFSLYSIILALKIYESEDCEIRLQNVYSFLNAIFTTKTRPQKKKINKQK